MSVAPLGKSILPLLPRLLTAGLSSGYVQDQSARGNKSITLPDASTMNSAYYAIAYQGELALKLQTTRVTFCWL